MTRPLPLLLLVACGHPDVLGTWTGDCQVSSMGYTETFSFSLDLAEGDGREITGTGTLDDGYQVQDVTVSGERKGKELSLTLELDDPGTATEDMGLNYHVQGKLTDDTIEGTCVVGTMGVGIPGDLVLDRS